MTSNAQKRANLTKPGGNLDAKSPKAKRWARKRKRAKERPSAMPSTKNVGMFDAVVLDDKDEVVVVEGEWEMDSGIYDLDDETPLTG